MIASLRMFVVVATSAAALSACKEDHATLAGQASAPPVYVTQGEDPPPAPPLPASYSSAAPALYDGYALADRARAFDQAVARRRPDFAFRYQRERPLAWRTADDYSMYAEPADSGYRDYYYAPRAEHPYFVRDREYGYGYGPDGRLSAVYDAAGALLPNERLGQMTRAAADYYLRAQTLRRYALDDGNRTPFSDREWSQLAPGYYSAEQAWLAAPDRQPQWREWRRSHVVSDAPYDHEPRHDNGRHLGWYKHGHKGWKGDEGEDRFAIAYGSKAYAAEEEGHGRWKKEKGARSHGRDGGGDDRDDGDEGEGHGHGHGKKD